MDMKIKYKEVYMVNKPKFQKTQIGLGMLLLIIAILISGHASAFTDGAALYADNCASCHGPLATSEKLGRDASQIQDAINTVPAMSSLSSLSQTDIQAIADALSTNATTNDTTAPTTTISGVVENESFSNSVTITLNATDNEDGSGIKETLYSINGGDTVTYAGPFTVDIVGQDNMTYWSVDNADNIESPNMVNFTIEATTPITTEPQLVLTLTPGTKAANFSSAVLLDNTTTVVESASSISEDGLTATFNLSGITPGFYSIEVNNLTSDRVPTYIDDNTINQNQSVTGTLTSSVIGDASNPTKYSIKARSGGRHPVVSFATGQNESKLPFVIVYNTSVQMIEIRAVNTSELLTSFTPTNASNSVHTGLGGTSFQDWQFGPHNHGIVYNNTDSSCNGCHIDMNTKPANYTDVAVNNGWCYNCHYGGTNGGDSNGFVDPIQAAPAPFGFIVTPQSITVAPSENAIYDLNISNIGNVADTYMFAVDNGGANVVLSMNNTSVDNVSIEPQESASIFMTVNSAVTGTFTVNVTATSEADTNNSITVSTDTIVGAVPTAPGVNAMREIDSQFIGPGDSTNVTVNISSDVTQALVLQETIPEGWNLTRISDDADSYRTNSVNEWLWINVTSGINKTVVYKLTAPSNASIGDYSINGSVINSTGMVATVGGSDTVSISIIGYYKKLGDNPNKIDTSDVLQAIQDWRDGVIADGFERPITSEELTSMLDAWAMRE
jgi:hypothetical protein